MISLRLTTQSDAATIPSLVLYPSDPSEILKELAERSNFKSKFGEVLITSEEIFVGVGETALVSSSSRKLGGKIARAISHLKAVRFDLRVDYPQEIFEGLLLGGFDQRLYGSKEVKQTEVLIPEAHADSMTKSITIADAVNKTRTIINTPGNSIPGNSTFNNSLVSIRFTSAYIVFPLNLLP